jgi:hypothetical protein
MRRFLVSTRPRRRSATTAVGGRVWLFGGIGKGESIADTAAYDRAINIWTTGPKLPARCTISWL